MGTNGRGEGVYQVNVSIQLMSPASGDKNERQSGDSAFGCFHSINVPSEWGQNMTSLTTVQLNSLVSIQLMSPASGDQKS